MIRSTTGGLLVPCTLVAALLCSACGGTAADKSAAAPPGAQDAQAALMDRGLNFLYRGGDADSAVATFRLVLSQNPNHYGARFQLARALDRAGEPNEAHKMWDQVLASASAIRDSATIAMAKERLAKPDTVTQEALMKAGLDLLYKKGDGLIASQIFQQVLARNPAHYGAHFQLAVALDKAGKRAEARVWWERVLRLAQSIKDQPTIDRAAARLREPS